MTHPPSDENPFLTAFGDTTKRLDKRDDYVSTAAKKPLVIDLPHRSGASTRVGHDRDIQSVGGSEMDRNTAARVRSGKIRPESRIDLHGDTIDQARARTQAFITNAVDHGLRCVLIITGKGTYGATGTNNDTQTPDFYSHDTPQKRGRIREHLPQWMREPPLHRLVLMITPAQPKDGGTGAFYVYLRQEK